MKHDLPLSISNINTFADIFRSPELAKSSVMDHHNGKLKHPWEIKNNPNRPYKALLQYPKQPWPKHIQGPIATHKPQLRPDALLNDCRVWFIGHATVLLQIGAYNFITDPVWAKRASPFAFIGPKRVRDPGISLEELPTIHGVLLSHNHYDHMDTATLTWLFERDQMPIYTGLGVACYLPNHFNVVELDWWQSVTVGDFCITFTPAQHFSGRGLNDRNKSLWGGLYMSTPHHRLFFAGDTGYSAHFSAVGERLGAPDLALLPIGAYAPQEFFSRVHMDPAEALQSHLDLKAKLSLAIHYRTFKLTLEGIDQPEMDLRRAMDAHQLNHDLFRCLNEGFDLSL